MTLNRWIAVLAALAVLALPALSLADHHEAGGEAAEHRSDRAAEKSNAQWDPDNEGRPEKHHGDDGDEVSEKDKKDKKEKKDKKGSKSED
jgi:hypothetical protein